MSSQEPNFYWPVYKSIEKEIIDLSYNIHLNDEQLFVFSIKIAELIMRCVVEIESISKDLYYVAKKENVDHDTKDRKKLKFDFDCIAYLEKKWDLSKKQIRIKAPNLFFSNKVLFPLSKKELSDFNAKKPQNSGWQKSYQEIKHNRAEGLNFANIRTLIYSVGALYILNIYHKNEQKHLQLKKSVNNLFFDTFQDSGSDLFYAKCEHVMFPCCGYMMTPLPDYESCIYLLKTANADKIIQSKYDELLYHEKLLLASPSWPVYEKTQKLINPNYNIRNDNRDIELIVSEIGDENLRSFIYRAHEQCAHKVIDGETKILLNKKQTVYPELENNGIKEIIKKLTGVAT